jgi:ribosome-associated translation inhibitor RaiA
MQQDTARRSKTRGKQDMLYQMAKQSKHTDIPADFDDVVDRELDKLVPLLADYPEDTMVRIIVDDASGTDDVEVSLRLSLPSQLLVSHETGAATTLTSVFERALKELRRQLLQEKERRAQ